MTPAQILVSIAIQNFLAAVIAGTIILPGGAPIVSKVSQGQWPVNLVVNNKIYKIVYNPVTHVISM